jgi:GT2 family glycosyltransferase
MSSVPVSVVVPTRQRAGRLPGLVAALSCQEGVPEFEIVIVDDASSDGTADVLVDLQSREPRLRTTSLPRRGGPAVARNVGCRLAHGQIIAFTDDDCIPDPTWLRELVAAHHSGLDIAQGVTLPDIERYGQRGTFSNTVEVRHFSYLFQTCNISYRRAVLDAAGGFDEEYGYSRGGAPNGEDADLGWRATEAGAVAGFVPTAVVVHPVSASSFVDAVRSRLRSSRMVYFVRRHPGYRQHAPSRYFFQPSHPSTAVALAGVAVALASRRPPGIVAGAFAQLPYLYYRTRVLPRPGRRRHLPVILVAGWIVDVTDVLVMVTASVRWRTLFL